MKSMTLLVGLIALGVARASWGHGGWAGGWAGAYGVGAPWAAGHWGGAPAPVHDTPEVAAAKAAHLAAHAAAKSGAWAGAGAGAWHGGAGAWNGGGWAGGDDGQWHDDTHQYDTYGAWGGNDDGQWHGDNAGHWDGDSGQWHGDNGQWHGDNGQWHGDNGHWNGDNSGQWNPAADGSWAGNYNAWAANGGVWAGHHAGNAWAYGGGWGGHGAHGVPHDTPEVAAAKAAHHAAHAAAAHRWRRSVFGLGLAAPVFAAHGVGLVNPNALPVPLDDVHTAAAKNAQLIQQATEGTRNILGGGIPLALPADTHEVAVGKVAHAVATETQKALVGAHGAWGHGLVGGHLW